NVPVVNCKVTPRMLLTGDIGGTKTLLGLFEAASARPRALAVRAYTTLDFEDLPAMIAVFLADVDRKATAVDQACFGVAGPIIGDRAELPHVHVPWRVDARAVA